LIGPNTAQITRKSTTPAISAPSDAVAARADGGDDDDGSGAHACSHVANTHVPLRPPEAVRARPVKYASARLSVDELPPPPPAAHASCRQAASLQLPKRAEPYEHDSMLAKYARALSHAVSKSLAFTCSAGTLGTQYAFAAAISHDALAGAGEVGARVNTGANVGDGGGSGVAVQKSSHDAYAHVPVRLV